MDDEYSRREKWDEREHEEEMEREKTPVRRVKNATMKEERKVVV